MACWGAAELMRREFDLPITAITGPATDNEVGQVYITGGLGLPAHNARRDAAGLLAVVRQAIAEWAERVDPSARAGGPDPVRRSGGPALSGVSGTEVPADAAAGRIRKEDELTPEQKIKLVRAELTIALLRLFSDGGSGK